MPFRYRHSFDPDAHLPDPGYEQPATLHCGDCGEAIEDGDEHKDTRVSTVGRCYTVTCCAACFAEANPPEAADATADGPR